jgi:guanylate kinase
VKHRKRKLIALAAPSGGGKTTLCRMLLAKYPQTALSISYTTRPSRGNEKDSVEYHFVSRSLFQEMIAKNDFVEWAEVHGHLYGTSKSFLDKEIAADKVILLDIDVQGVDSLKAVYGDLCLSVFVEPPSLRELELRLRARNTESEEKLQVRLKNAEWELAQAGRFDYRLLNATIDQAFAHLCEIVEREASLAQ